MEKTKTFIQRYKHLFIQDDTISNALNKNFEIHNDTVIDNISCNYANSILGDSADEVVAKGQQSFGAQ
jgi:hypothetical protein